MSAETVVLDNTDLPGMIAAETGEPVPVPEPEILRPRPQKAEAQKAASKPPERSPETPKPVETKGEPPNGKRGPEQVAEDGLTEEERKTYTEKMRKSIAWRTARMREAEEKVAHERQGRLSAEERARVAERALGEAKLQPLVQAVPEGPKEPKRDAFETDEAYTAALIDYRVELRLAKERADRQKEQIEAEKALVIAAANARIAKAIELVPDFEEMRAQSEDVKVPPHIAGYMVESELIAELGYFFAQHPDELDRISQLKPSNALVEIGKIESKLQPFGSGPPQEDRPKAEASGASPKPSTAADGNPSRPRVSVPVVQPLTARGAPEVDALESTDTRAAVRGFEKRTGANLSRRSRH